MRVSPRIMAGPLTCLVVLSFGCADEVASPVQEDPISLIVVSGQNQTGGLGEPLDLIACAAADRVHSFDRRS